MCLGFSTFLKNTSINIVYFGLILLYGCGRRVKFLSAGNESISGHIEAFGVPRSWHIKSS